MRLTPQARFPPRAKYHHRQLARDRSWIPNLKSSTDQTNNQPANYPRNHKTSIPKTSCTTSPISRSSKNPSQIRIPRCVAKHKMPQSPLCRLAPAAKSKLPPSLLTARRQQRNRGPLKMQIHAARLLHASVIQWWVARWAKKVKVSLSPRTPGGRKEPGSRARARAFSGARAPRRYIGESTRRARRISVAFSSSRLASHRAVSHSRARYAGRFFFFARLLTLWSFVWMESCGIFRWLPVFFWFFSGQVSYIGHGKIVIFDRTEALSAWSIWIVVHYWIIVQITGESIITRIFNKNAVQSLLQEVTDRFA